MKVAPVSADITTNDAPTSSINSSPTPVTAPAPKSPVSRDKRADAY
jgi:hypothetical protein